MLKDVVLEKLLRVVKERGKDVGYFVLSFSEIVDDVSIRILEFNFKVLIVLDLFSILF